MAASTKVRGRAPGRPGVAAGALPVMLVLSTTLAGCPSAEKPPTPPSVADLTSAYSAPDGRLTAAVARTLVLEADTRLAVVADAASLVAVLVGALSVLATVEGLSDPLTAAPSRAVDLAPAGRGAAAPGLEVMRQGLGVEAGAWVELERRCPGWGLGGGDRGALTLRAVVDEEGLNPVIWGEVAACRAAVGDERREYTGAVRLHAPDFGRDGVLVALAGTLRVEGAATRDFTFDVRVADGVLYTRQVVDGASFLLGVAVDAAGGTATLQVRDADGTWLCSVDRCAGPDGRELTL